MFVHFDHNQAFLYLIKVCLTLTEVSKGLSVCVGLSLFCRIISLTEFEVSKNLQNMTHIDIYL